MGDLALYQQIKQYLINEIEAGRLKPGDRIPTQEQLCELFHTTRVTVQRAVDELAEENVLVRMGRRGTFVSKVIWERHLNRFQSSYEDLMSKGIVPTTRVLNITLITPPPDMAKLLQLEPGEKVAHIQRLRLVEGEPFGLLYDWLPLDLYRPLLGVDLGEGSLYAHVEEKTGRRITGAKQVIGISNLSRKEAKLLGVSSPHAALEMDVTCYTDLGQPLLVGKYIFRGDRYRMTVTLRR